MGAFNEIFSEVRERLGGRMTIDSRITRWINDAYFEILMNPRYKFFELDKMASFNTSSGVRDYELSSIAGDVWFILSLRDETTEREVLKKDVKTFDRTVHTLGQPTRYARFGDKLILDPTPNGVYSMMMRYRQRVGEIGVGQMTVLNREWDEAFTILAVAKGYQGLEQPAKAQEQLQLFHVKLSSMEAVLSLEDDDKEPTIAPFLQEIR